MKRILTAALAALMCAAAADDKPAEKTDRAEQLKELEADFQKLIPDVARAYRNADSAEERDKALARLDPIFERGYKLVAEDPKDDASLSTLLLLAGGRPQPPDKLIDLLTEHHLNNAKLAQHLPRLGGSPAGQKLLRAAMGQSKSKAVKGIATFVYAKELHDQAEQARGQRAADLNKEAETLLEKVRHEYGDIAYDDGTLKDKAGRTLFAIRNLVIGKKAPEVVSKDLDDKPVKLSDLKGKVVVLDIWATWCGPCRAMIPHEREMVEKLKGKPFVLVSISADEKKETLKEFLETEKMPWTHWWEGRREGGIINDWNVEFFPTIYVLDAKGVIRYKHVRGKELEEAVEKLVAEAEKK